MLCHWRFPCTIELKEIRVFYSHPSSDLVACIILYLYIWSLAVFLWLLVLSVHQSNLVKDVTICQNVCMLEYKVQYPDDLEDPPDVGLSSEDEAKGMKEILGVAQRVALPRPSLAQQTPTLSTSKSLGSTDPGVPEGYVKLAGDEVVIRKVVLRGIKRGTELALKGQAPTSFSLGQAMAGDLPFEVPVPAPHQVHCDICHKDLPTPKALRHHLQAHKVMTHYLCPKCGKHLASGQTWDMHKESCGSTEFTHNCQECRKGYHQKQSLVEHIKAKHQPIPSAADRTCLECGVVFNLLKTMREHHAVHRDPFPCPVEGCKEQFSLPKRLNRHLREKHGYNAQRY